MAMQDIHNATKRLGLPLGEKMALIQIAIFVRNGSGVADVANSVIAGAAECSDRHVRRIKKKLVEKGLVYPINGVGQGNWTRYLFLLGRKAHEIFEMLKKHLGIARDELVALTRTLVSAQKRTLGVRFHKSKGDIPAHKRGHPGTQKRTSGARKEDIQESAESDESESLQSEKESEEKEKAADPAIPKTDGNEPDLEWTDVLEAFMIFDIAEKTRLQNREAAMEMVLKNTGNGTALASFTADQISRWGSWFNTRRKSNGETLLRPNKPETIRASILDWMRIGEPERDGHHAGNNGSRRNGSIENDYVYPEIVSKEPSIVPDPAEMRRKLGIPAKS